MFQFYSIKSSDDFTFGPNPLYITFKLDPSGPLVRIFLHHVLCTSFQHTRWILNARQQIHFSRNGHTSFHNYSPILTSRSSFAKSAREQGNTDSPNSNLAIMALVSRITEHEYQQSNLLLKKINLLADLQWIFYPFIKTNSLKLVHGNFQLQM